MSSNQTFLSLNDHFGRPRRVIEWFLKHQSHVWRKIWPISSTGAPCIDMENPRNMLGIILVDLVDLLSDFWITNPMFDFFDTKIHFRPTDQDANNGTYFSDSPRPIWMISEEKTRLYWMHTGHNGAPAVQYKEYAARVDRSPPNRPLIFSKKSWPPIDGPDPVLHKFWPVPKYKIRFQNCLGIFSLKFLTSIIM